MHVNTKQVQLPWLAAWWRTQIFGCEAGDRQRGREALKAAAGRA